MTGVFLSESQIITGNDIMVFISCRHFIYMLSSDVHEPDIANTLHLNFLYPGGKGQDKTEETTPGSGAVADSGAGVASPVLSDVGGRWGGLAGSYD